MVEYIESNVINQYYIYNDNTNRHYKIEYADPNKLYKVHLNYKNNWKTIIKNSFIYYYLKIPWEHNKALYFYILTDNIKLFETLPINNFKDWLNENHNETFLITGLVYNIEDIKIIYRNNYLDDLIHPVQLDNLEEVTEISRIIKFNCYSIGSGLTLLLAYHRLGLIKSRILYSPLKEWYIVYKRDNLYFKINDNWSQLYYKNVPTMIADFPFYYLCFGPNFASNRIRRIFFSKQDQSLIQYAKEENKLVVANALTAMYPYFDKYIFEKYKRTFSSYISSYIMDVNGYVKSIISTNKSWIYWKKTQHANIIELLKITKNSDDIYNLMKNILYVAFILYSNKSYDKRKIRELWNIFVDYLDPYLLIHDLLVKTKLDKSYNFPVLFIKDLFKNHNIDIFYNPLPTKLFEKPLSIYNLLSKFENNHIKYYYKDINKRILCILCTLSRLDKAIYHSMIRYLKNNRQMLLRYIIPNISVNIFDLYDRSDYLI